MNLEFIFKVFLVFSRIVIIFFKVFVRRIGIFDFFFFLILIFVWFLYSLFLNLDKDFLIFLFKGLLVSFLLYWLIVIRVVLSFFFLLNNMI